MAEEFLFRLLAQLERLGVWVSALAWFTVAGGAAAMARALRGERRAGVWIPAGAVGLIALAANLADYFATLRRSPDLSLESNPLWRNVVDHYGLTVAKWYGLTGKIFVSILAAQLFAYHITTRERLFPERAATAWEFLRGLGSRSRTLKERALALFTLFAFFFAGVNLLYFYVAYANWLEDAETYELLPPFPLVVVLLVVFLAVACVTWNYRVFRQRKNQPLLSCDQ